jgi:hypothetical protein
LEFGDAGIVTGGGKAAKYLVPEALHRVVGKVEVNSPCADSLLPMALTQHALVWSAKSSPQSLTIFGDEVTAPICFPSAIPTALAG